MASNKGTWFKVKSGPLKGRTLFQAANESRAAAIKRYK